MFLTGANSGGTKVAKKKRMSRKIIIQVLLSLMVFFDLYSKTRVLNLHCEMLMNPIGIDILQPRLSWQTIGEERGIMQVAYQLVVASSIDNLEPGKADFWDSGKIYSDQSSLVEYKGKPLLSGQKYYWKVKVWTNKQDDGNWGERAFWSMGLLNRNEWKAKWIGLDSSFSWDDPLNFHSKLSARYFRKEFKSSPTSTNRDKKIRQATASISGLGLYELYLNGKKVGDQVLSPTISDYSKKIYYNTFDITNFLEIGSNTIGVSLGNGRFFSMRPGEEKMRKEHIPTIQNFGFPKLLFQLELTYEDGSKEMIVSDESWKVTADGPIRSNSEYDGEKYDATKELTGWNKNNFNSSKWLNVTMTKSPGGEVQAQPNPNMKIMKTLKPLSVREDKPGVYVFDMGQNMVGWEKLHVKGERGKEIILKFAERLNEDGTLYVANFRNAEVTDKYILKGDINGEAWEPHFTYHGFQYIEVTGFPGKPDISSIEGEVIYDEMETTGGFKSSDSLLNKIFSNASWGISGNYKGMPADCPQRDERMGWLGDRSINCYGESFIFNNAMLYSKWMEDIKDAQREDGSIPDIAPAYWKFYSDNMTWPSSYLFVSQMLYQQYGDIKVLQKHYPYMKKWMLYMQKYMTKDFLLSKDSYGDWCMPPETLQLIHSEDSTRQTPGPFIGSVYFYHCLKMMEEFASLTNNSQDTAYFNDLSRKAKMAVNNSFLNKEQKYYANNTITANLLALSFDIVPSEFRQGVFENIKNKTNDEFQGHLSTGLIGGQWLMRGLTDNGSPELAYKIATNTTYPSWGYMVKNGATTIWELWNGNTADPAMNSGNHVMLLGDLIIWYFEDLGGIKAIQPGFKKIKMNPILPERLNFVNVSYQSLYGLIKSNWKKNGKQFNWEITIPENSKAEVYIPASSMNKVLENKKTLDSFQEIKFLRMEKGRAVFEVGSGSYEFESIMGTEE